MSRIQRFSKSDSIQDDFSDSNVTASSNNSKKRCSSFLALVVALVFIAEIAFLGRLDMVDNSALINSVAESFYQFTVSTQHNSQPQTHISQPQTHSPQAETCEEWLEREDALVYSRDFVKSPILVRGPPQEFPSCAVGCMFGLKLHKKSDAVFGSSYEHDIASVHRSMESSAYYADNIIPIARGMGYDILMTTSLSSDVPVGYFSWAEYDIMAPLEPKNESALAAAFISNCAAKNFRLKALKALEKAGVKIDSYGGCFHNRDGRVNKVKALKHYKFSLAFENSNVEDYVTEKFFQSLVAGSVPVVVGAPNIQEFAPSPNSVLSINDLRDVPSIAKTMKSLAGNTNAYNQMLRWKIVGPSDSFKALIDMAAVHSSCRLCIEIATRIQQKEEEKSPHLWRRPCKCSEGLEAIYHIYVRERGRFKMESIFLRSNNLTLEALESAVMSKYKSLKHIPVWKSERPESIRGDNLKIYRIHPLGMTQRQALYTVHFKDNYEFKRHIAKNPCAKFEVIFV